MGSTLVGSTLGRFRVDRLLGRGGMGAVYAAFDEKLERDVALKILNDEGDAALQKKRLLREARLAAKLQHPNIATVYEVDELEGRLLIVMELLEGSSLRKMLTQRKMSVDEAISIARDMARALARAHTANVIHRDIKPENVFVTTPSPDAILAKVLDFGLARQRPTVVPGMPPEEATATNTTSRGDMWGTPGYVSPEQAHGYPVDLRTDIFSFGIVFYEMLAGIKPFRGENPIAVMIATTKAEPRPLREITPNVPPEIVDIVSKCLKKEPDGRYKDGAELAAALESYVRGTTQSGKMTMNVVGSSPNLPQLSSEDLLSDDTIITTGDVLGGMDDNAPTTGGPAIIEMVTARDAVPSLEQQRTDHMKLVAAIGCGVAIALVVVIVAVSWATPSSSAAAKAKAAASASASASASAAAAAAAQLDLPPPPPPSEIVAPPDPASSLATTELEPPATTPSATPTTTATHRKRPPGSKPADCVDPFTKDAKGVRIPKLHCL